MLTIRLVDYAIAKYNPTSRPVLSMHLNAANCQCPTCVSIRTGNYNQKARNVYSIPVGSDRQSLARAAREMDRLAGDVSDWSTKGSAHSKPVIALEGDDRELKDQQARFASLASELNARSRDAPDAGGHKGLGSLGDVDRRESRYNA